MQSNTKNHSEIASRARLSEGDELSGWCSDIAISLRWLETEMNPPGSRRGQAVLALLSPPPGPEHNHFKLALACGSTSTMQLFHRHVIWMLLEADAGSRQHLGLWISDGFTVWDWTDLNCVCPSKNYRRQKWKYWGKNQGLTQLATIKNKQKNKTRSLSVVQQLNKEMLTHDFRI